MTDASPTDEAMLADLIFAREAENGIRVGEPVHDKIGGGTAVVTDYLGPMHELDDALLDLITKSHGNQHVQTFEDTTVVEVAFTGVRSKPSKTYAYPETRLARPWIESATDGLSAAQLAECELAAMLLAVNGGTAFDQRLEHVLDALLSETQYEYANAIAADLRAEVGTPVVRGDSR